MFPQLFTLQVTTTGTAGSATGTRTTPQTIRGYIQTIRVVYAGGPPATTDLTISEADGFARVLFTLTDNNTSGVFYPRVLTHSITGVQSTTDLSRYFLFDTRITAAIAQSNAITNVATVTLQIVGV